MNNFKIFFAFGLLAFLIACGGSGKKQDQSGLGVVKIAAFDLDFTDRNYNKAECDGGDRSAAAIKGSWKVQYQNAQGGQEEVELFFGKFDAQDLGVYHECDNNFSVSGHVEFQAVNGTLTISRSMAYAGNNCKVGMTAKTMYYTVANNQLTLCDPKLGNVTLNRN